MSADRLGTGWRTPSVGAWTGAAAVAVAALTIAEFTVQQTAVGRRPPLSAGAELTRFAERTAGATLTVILIDTFLMASLLVFLSGFRQMVVLARPDLRWVADIAYAAGVVFVAVTLVGDGMEAGTAIGTDSATSDPSAVRALTSGHALLFGPIGCVLTAVVAGASGYLLLASAILPRWTGVLALGVAVLNIAAVPTAYGGTDDESIHSVGGWGTALLATFPWLVWVVSVGVVVIRERREHHERARAASPLTSPDTSSTNS